MFWRTFTTTVALFMVIAGVIAADQSVSDRATLTLQGTVRSSADVSIRPTHDDPTVAQVHATTNVRGGLMLTLERKGSGADSALTIDGAPAHFQNGRAHLGDVSRTRTGSGALHNAGEGDGRSIVVAYSGDEATQMVLDIAAQ
ncbi:MAG: hypothetical protein ACOCYB_08950 [Alkalispirochaeta sp.]